MMGSNNQMNQMAGILFLPYGMKMKKNRDIIIGWRLQRCETIFIFASKVNYKINNQLNL
jgi:hypothetical protein